MPKSRHSEAEIGSKAHDSRLEGEVRRDGCEAQRRKQRQLR